MLDECPVAPVVYIHLAFEAVRCTTKLNVSLVDLGSQDYSVPSRAFYRDHILVFNYQKHVRSPSDSWNQFGDAAASFQIRQCLFARFCNRKTSRIFTLIYAWFILCSDKYVLESILIYKCSVLLQNETREVYGAFAFYKK